MVYGYITNELGYVSGATVDVVDKTNFQGVVSVTTDSIGYYQLNIQDISTDADNISISAIKGNNGNSKVFTLSTADLYERVDLILKENSQTDVSNVSINISGQ